MVVKAFETITLARVDDGAQGIPGKAGADGKTPYFHTAWANMTHVADEFASFALSEMATVRFGKDNNWVYKTFDAGTYKADNATFGRDPYPKMAKVAEVVSDFSVEQSANKAYLGTYTDFTQADSLDPTSYQWSQIKGADGKDGVAGKDGLGIKATAIAYQLSSSGTTTPTGTWSTTVPTLAKGQYLWTRTTLTYTDNTTEPVYSVSYVAKDGNNGTDGVAGKDGVGIKSTTITYATSTSGTSAPTSGWVSTPPTATAGQFVWTRTIWTYTDNTTETGYSVGKIGEKGATGATGNGVKLTAITYQSSTSGVTPPTGTWSTSIPSVGAGNYLWTRTITTYTDGTSTTMYAVGMMGATGAKGDPGSKDVPVITSGTAYPSNPKSGDMHWMTNSSGVVIGYYVYSGSQWVVQKVDAQALNVSSLSALSANLGTVNAGTINGVSINGSQFKTTYKDVPKDTEVGTTIKVSGDITIGDGAINNDFIYTGNTGADRGNNQWTSDGLSGTAYASANGDNTDLEITRYSLTANSGLELASRPTNTARETWDTTQIIGQSIFLKDGVNIITGQLNAANTYDSGWQNLVFTGGAITSPSNPVAIRRIGKTVYLRGDIILPTTAGYVWCIIPDEFRPAVDSRFTTFAESGDEYRMIFRINISGQISTIYNTQNKINYHLAGTNWAID